jgi:predicted GNAT family N-acyltransferase
MSVEKELRTQSRRWERRSQPNRQAVAWRVSGLSGGLPDLRTSRAAWSDLWHSRCFPGIFQPMIFDSFRQFTPQDFVFKIAEASSELEGYWKLRQKIFCKEQRIFSGTDHDEIDGRAIPIICESLIAGMADSVVGVVRIDQREARVWYGSRLGVDWEYRSIHKLSPGVAIRNHLPVYRGLGALGAGLIYKAVSTAHALGCVEFLATVQHQNAKFFQRLHWEPIGELELFGLPHVKMRADLSHYRPAEVVF